jgi:hypothetical protein
MGRHLPGVTIRDISMQATCYPERQRPGPARSGRSPTGKLNCYMSYDPLSEVIDEPIDVDDSTVMKLQILKAVDKFGSLPGENTSEEKKRLSAILNDLLLRLIGGVQANPTKLWILAEFQQSLALVENEDTEAREHVGAELELIMDVLGIESSDGMLAAYLGGI